MLYLYHLPLLLTFVLMAFSPLAAEYAVEQRFIDAGLVNIDSIDESIQIDLVNANAKHNIFRQDFYQGLTRAYLQEEVAHQLAQAQGNLKKRHPDYSLLIMDAARPRSVSRDMYEMLRDTQFSHYVAHPDSGSMHNYGVAVDVTIVNNDGEQLDMGFIPFYKNRIAVYASYMLLKARGLTDQQRQNRQLLKEIMTEAGFIPLSHEWWHFDGIHKDIARQRFDIIE